MLDITDTALKVSHYITLHIDLLTFGSRGLDYKMIDYKMPVLET